MARSSFSQIIADRARDEPTAPVVIDEHGTLTAAELDRRATSLAHELRHRGVRPDDLVTVSLPNTRDFVIACIAAWRAGATVEPVNPELPDEIRHDLEQVWAPTAAIGARPATATITWLASVDVPDDTRPITDQAASCWKAVPTSGSTGRPKIVRTTAPALLDPDRPVAAFLPHRATQIVAGPLWHSAVFTYAFRGLLTGHRLVIMPRFDAARWVALVEAHQATWGLLVPTMLRRLMRLDPAVRSPQRVRSLQRILHMGAVCAPELKRAVIAWLGCERVDEVYAGSESNGLVMIGGCDWLQHPGSVGRPIAGTVVSIRDTAGREVPLGTVGQIWMHRGDTAAYAYVGARSARDKEGWDTLSDLGHVDADGYVYVHERVDDMINRGGELIAPATVEAVLEQHPQVVEAVVAGVGDHDLGSVVHAIVQVDTDEVGTPTALADELVKFAVTRLGRFAPVVVRVVTHPLRNEAGKVRRQALIASSGA